MNYSGWEIPDSAIRMGLEATTIPGRFQVVESDSSKALGCLSARLILDGGNQNFHSYSPVSIDLEGPHHIFLSTPKNVLDDYALLFHQHTQKTLR